MTKMNESEQLTLLKKIIAPASRENILPVNLSRLEKIIKERIPNALEKNAPPNFPELYFDFEYVYSKFYDFLLFTPLIGKTVVALGGGFSSGKSTFLNTLLGNAKILPTAIRPSTSVPTYVIKSDSESAEGINTFGTKMPLDFADIRAIAHGFGETEETDGEITLGHLLRSLFVATSQMPYENIAFLDTPGYSKADSEDYSEKTDEKIAHSQLNASDYILWFVAADAGTISVDDVNFLASLDKDIPKLIIINKADKAPNAESLGELKEKIKAALDLKGIRYEEVLTYSRKETVICDRERVQDYLHRVNRVDEVNFARNFRKIFTECEYYYDDAISESQRNLSYINRSLTFATDSEELIRYLYILLDDMKTNIDRLSKIKKELKELKNDFFEELKEIARHVNLYMPNPIDVDFIDDEEMDLLSIVVNIVKEKGITDSRDIWHEINNHMTVFQDGDVTNKQIFDFSTLQKEASQEILYHHPLAESNIKELYLTLLTSLLAVDGANDKTWKHIYRIALSGNYEGDVHELFHNALRMNDKILINIIETIKLTPLRDIFILDSLVLLTNCPKNSNRAIKFLSCVYALLNVQIETIAQGIELVKLYLSKNEELYKRQYHEFFCFDLWNICCYSPFCIKAMTRDISFAKSCDVEKILVYAASVKNMDSIDIDTWIASDITFMFSSFEDVGVISWNKKHVRFFCCEFNSVNMINARWADNVVFQKCSGKDISHLYMSDGYVEECNFQGGKPISCPVFEFWLSNCRERYVYVKKCVFINFYGERKDCDISLIKIDNHVSIENNHFISLSFEVSGYRKHMYKSSILSLKFDSEFEGSGIIKNNTIECCTIDSFWFAREGYRIDTKNVRGLPMYNVSDNEVN